MEDRNPELIGLDSRSVPDIDLSLSIFQFPFSSFQIRFFEFEFRISIFGSHSRQGSPNVVSHSWGVNGSSPALG